MARRKGKQPKLKVARPEWDAEGNPVSSHVVNYEPPLPRDRETMRPPQTARELAAVTMRAKQARIILLGPDDIDDPLQGWSQTIQQIGEREDGQQGHLYKRAAAAVELHATWQKEADAYWSRHPDASRIEVARHIEHKLGGNPDTIRKRIRK